jgi:hypothetical protein
MAVARDRRALGLAARHVVSAVACAANSIAMLMMILVRLAGRVIPFGSMKRLYVTPRRRATFFHRCLSFFLMPCFSSDIRS